MTEERVKELQRRHFSKPRDFAYLLRMAQNIEADHREDKAGRTRATANGRRFPALHSTDYNTYRVLFSVIAAHWPNRDEAAQLLAAFDLLPLADDRSESAAPALSI